jgi:hypothetical protein
MVAGADGYWLEKCCRTRKRANLLRMGRETRTLFGLEESIMRKWLTPVITLIGVAGACTAEAIVITSFQGAMQPTTPAPGWSYLWNSGGAIGNPANYTSLLPTTDPGAFYDNDGVVGLPGPNPGAFVYLGLVGTGLLNAGQPGGHPGRGLGDDGTAFGFERFAIAAFTLSAPASGVSITNSLLTNANFSSDGVHAQVYLNNSSAPLVDASTAAGQGMTTTFDVGLGNLAAGDVIFVAVGPRNTNFADSFSLRYEITATAVAAEPSSLGLLASGGIVFALAARHLRRRRKPGTDA